MNSHDIILGLLILMAAACVLALCALPVMWIMSDLGTRQDRRIKRLKLDIEEKKLRQTILEMEGRQSEDGWRHK